MRVVIYFSKWVMIRTFGLTDSEKSKVPRIVKSPRARQDSNPSAVTACDLPAEPQCRSCI